MGAIKDFLAEAFPYFAALTNLGSGGAAVGVSVRELSQPPPELPQPIYMDQVPTVIIAGGTLAICVGLLLSLMLLREQLGMSPAPTEKGNLISGILGSIAGIVVLISACFLAYTPEAEADVAVRHYVDTNVAFGLVLMLLGFLVAYAAAAAFRERKDASKGMVSG